MKIASTSTSTSTFNHALHHPLLLASSLFISLVAAQNPTYPGSTCGTQLVTFNTCVDNALTDVTTTAYPDVAAACDSLRNDQPAYFAFCPNDPNAVSIQSSITANCNVAQTTATGPVTSVSRSVAPVTASPLHRTTTTAPVTTAPAAGVTTTKTGGAERCAGAAWGVALAVAVGAVVGL
ncbi:hypothetical protein BC829DRAFT_445632 [Chytridium lagenaria]|nr:hypothetical protein BC829DRAFT_445632 [Chytridium lagenaria]